jgi:steroid 5-alpha reductase family enzyme
MLRGGLILLLSFPIFFINTITAYYLPFALYLPGPGELYFQWIDYIGVFIWTIGFSFETIADFQLLSFKKNPENKDKIMKKGLWKYIKRPNYLGETILWWGIFLMVIPITEFFPYVWFSLISPIILTILFFRVSIELPLERNSQKSRIY